MSNPPTPTFTNMETSITSRMEAKFALEGLSCSSCVRSVTNAALSLSLHNNEDDALVIEDNDSEYVSHLGTIDVGSVRVTLFPQSQLYLCYDIVVQRRRRRSSSSSDSTTAPNNNEDNGSYEVPPPLQSDPSFSSALSSLSTIATEKITECIEDIGFGAELLSNQPIRGTGDIEDNDNHNNQNGIIGSRVVYLEIEHNAASALRCLRDHPNVETVERVCGSHNGTTNHHKQSNNPLHSTNDTITTPLLSQQPTTTPGDTLRLSYNPTSIGIRTLLSDLNQCPESVTVGGYGSVVVRNANEHGHLFDRSEQRRRDEIASWKKRFGVAVVFALPVALSSMVIGRLPLTRNLWGQRIGFLGGVTVEDVVNWSLTTPVQFGSGGRFYRDAYYGLRKGGNLGMSFLVAVGTSAAYFYSVFVVVYNANCGIGNENGNTGSRRLMTSFETSALLITFVILGKYLECRAKSATSRALSELSHLSPRTATLVAVRDNTTISPDAADAATTTATTSSFSGSTPPPPTIRETPVPEKEISLDLLQLDDILLVRPGETIPTDGIITEGATTCDESMITGESVPLPKKPGDTVIGGTINIDGSVRVLTTVLGQDTILSKIVRLVEKAQESKAPIQEFADYISGRFVPMVFLFSVCTFTIWVILLRSSVLDGTKDEWPYREDGLNDWTLPLVFAISCLVVACPCALGLATPTAVMVGSGVGAKLGILIKGGEALQSTSEISAVVFDKTGTLTVGCPMVEDVHLLSDRAAFLFGAVGKSRCGNGALANASRNSDNHVSTTSASGSNLSPDEARKLATENILFVAACAENGSEHPLAKGIVARAAECGVGEGLSRPLNPTKDFLNDIGSGITCTVENCGSDKITHTIHVGNRRHLESNNIVISPGTFEAMEHLETKGQTSIVVSIDGQTEAVIGLIDRARDEASIIVNVLRHAMGIKVYMLTGDNARTATVVANDIGIPPSFVIADVLPQGKVECVQRLQSLGEHVAMIGDGVNDSPAIAQADVGIAIGAGTDVAIETADVVLMNSKLTDVITTIDLSKTIFRRIQLNFVWALGYNTLALPIAGGALYPIIKVVLPPFVAGIAMALSSLSVLFSSLLLSRYSPPKIEKMYGRKLRRGKLGLEMVSILSSLYPKGEKISIQCESMKQGTECRCPPESCKCDSCPKNRSGSSSSNSDISALMDETSLHVTEEESQGAPSMYPGCGTVWGGRCSCSQCNCNGCLDCRKLD